MHQHLSDPVFTEKLLGVSHYREFLKVLIEDPPNSRGEKAKISRKAGFSSRSYLSEILTGKKGLSRDSTARLKSALQLPKYWGHYFEYLVWLEHTELCPKNILPKDLKHKISQVKSDIKSQSETGYIEKKVALQLQRPQVFQVYAALGTEDTGASLEDILQRTGLEKSNVEKALNQLLECKATYEENNRYYAFVSKADALQYKNKSELSELIRLITSDLQKKREDIVKSPSSLTVYSAFSVHKSKRMALKSRLQEVITDVLDEFQDDSGDQVEQLFVNLFHQS